ncbi:hypothetical protein [Actinophytocola sp.]|uniref:hypothetical protein n=1 Tax=Actinophytocola sp. TaxID=1872138 RepID=UPI003899D845
MAHLSYTPTFHHTNWVDKIDRVEADGPNGCNNRFNAIAADLTQLSTVVKRIGTAIDQLNAPPAPRQQQLTLSPVLHPTPSAAGWETDSGLGTARATIGQATNNAFGVMNLTLSEGVRLASLRVRGARDGQVSSGAVALFRTPLRLAQGAPPVDQLATVDLVAAGSFDRQAPAVDVVSLIDPTTFRYFITARLVWNGSDAASAAINAIQLTLVPA